MKYFLLILTVSILWVSQGYCQDTDSEQIVKQAVKLYTGIENKPSEEASIAGYSVAGLVGAMIFGCVGFVAFIYGKKNQEFRPMVLGLLLLGYPYFVKDTMALYLAGSVLTIILFVWRE